MPADAYVEALAGSDIQTNPPKTNEVVQAMGKQYVSHINDMPPNAVLREIAQKVNVAEMEKVLMSEGLAKFADPQKKLIALIASKRAALSASK
jgi:transaldolase